MNTNPKPAYRDPSLPLEARVNDLIGRMTLEEKISQMVHDAPEIERLGVPAYNYWNEALHGVARAGLATVFPQAIGLAAAWDVDLMYQVAVATSDEGRAKHHAAVRNGSPVAYTGLTFWSPNINIFRDPRWGRGHETYGEDPYLTARLGVAFIKGIQGDDPKYLKASACAKHYAVHSGPEYNRFTFDAQVSQKDIRETYLPAFRAAVVEGKVENVMGAYNRLNGIPCCANEWLLGDVLRQEWGFEGHVVSDCGAIQLLHTTHGWTKTAEESVARAVQAGCDLNCGETYLYLRDAVAQGLVSEADLDRALRRVFRVRFRLGLFDPDEMVPFASIPESVVDCAAHRALARKAAQESIVLLKNNGILPLDQKKQKSLMIYGPTAARADVLLGNYYGLNPRLVTPLEGILGKLSPATSAVYWGGCNLTGQARKEYEVSLSYGRASDVLIVVMGLAPEMEGEAGDANPAEGPDRRNLELPASQEAFLRELHTTGKPIVLVLTGGSAMAVSWAQEHVDAILWIGYPGEEGGNALADVLFGDVSPSGKLPITFYKSTDDLPPFENYAMKGRTYRYFEGEPLYPFGYGLSYTQFAYRNLRLPTALKAGEAAQIAVEVQNAGQRASDEVVQVYLSALEAPVATPRYQLVGFKRIHLGAGEAQTVALTIAPEQLAVIGEDGVARCEPGRYRVTVGDCSPGARGLALGAAQPAVGEFAIR